MNREIKIIGREEEVEILNNLLDNEESKFIAIYGRRRVGKTFIIRKCLGKNIFFECAGLNTKEEDTNLQIANFWEDLIKHGFAAIVPPSTWSQAFTYLEQFIQESKSIKKKVIFLDEIAWFDTHKGGFLTALTKFWNSFCTKRSDIVLVICGSAASWIIKNVVNHKGGLHNRINRTIQLLPFTLSETKKYLDYKGIKLSFREIAMVYMVSGGIPYYISELKPGSSVNKIIDDLFFNKNPLLKNEFENLYSSLFKNYKNHLQVIDALAKNASGLTRQAIIANTTLDSGGTLSDTLEELEQCSFIKKFTPYEKVKVDALYRLMDEYTIFYYKFIKNKKAFNSGNTLGNSHSFKVWTGFAFENLCFRHVSQIAQALGIQGIQYNIYSFIDKKRNGAQIDMIIDRNDNCINSIEIKFHNQKYIMTKADAENIKHKVNTFIENTKTRKTIFITLITPIGSEKNQYYLENITNEITLDALFKP